MTEAETLPENNGMGGRIGTENNRVAVIQS